MEVTYDAHVDLDGRYWRIHVPQIDRTTQAQHLRDVDAMARDLIAVMEDIDADAVELQVHIELPADVRRHLAQAAKLREKAAEAQHAAAEESRLAARELAAAGLPLRDVGRALGISYQRAHQLVSG